MTTETIPDPYARTEIHGKPLDWATAQAIRVAEQRLGYELTILQGIGGAAASKGAHLDGRGVDLTTHDAANKLRVLKDIGFAIYFRETLPGVWEEHLHGMLVFESRTNTRGIAPVGFRQINSFDRRRDGLAADGPDDLPVDSYRPAPPAVFTLADYRASFKEPKMPKTNVQRARNRLTEAIHATGQAATLLDDTDPTRVVARGQRDELRAAQADLRAILEKLPKR